MSEKQHFGIVIEKSSNGTIQGNILRGPGIGIFVTESDNTKILNNQIIWTEERNVSIDAVQEMLEKLDKNQGEVKNILEELRKAETKEEFFGNLGKMADTIAVAQPLLSLFSMLLS